MAGWKKPPSGGDSSYYVPLLLSANYTYSSEGQDLLKFIYILRRAGIFEFKIAWHSNNLGWLIQQTIQWATSLDSYITSKDAN